ncbi:MAG TPA: dethiobiotin synthase [Candidatus Binataceae bacterium]|nr:dethiobiotin synthase [Candidatus Binataceae bacterium]
MPHGLFITGTEPRVGKTLIGCSLAFAAYSRGMKVGVMKPVETGCREVDGWLEPADARGLSFAAASDFPIELVCPYRYRSALAPAAAAEADVVAPPDLAEIVDAYSKIKTLSDLVIVEGAGGIMTPINWALVGGRCTDNADLARSLNLDIVIVIGNRVGCFNTAALTIHYAKSRGLGIIGLILNDTDATTSPATESNEASLPKMTGIPLLGRIRFKQPVPREIIDVLLAHS